MFRKPAAVGTMEVVVALATTFEPPVRLDAIIATTEAMRITRIADQNQYARIVT